MVVERDFLQDTNFVKSFNEIVTMEDLWGFLNGPLIDIIQEEWYTGEQLPEEERGMILSANRILGGIRLRQVCLPLFIVTSILSL